MQLVANKVHLPRQGGLVARSAQVVGVRGVQWVWRLLPYSASVLFLYLLLCTFDSR
jgi:hypothetical protein